MEHFEPGAKLARGKEGCCCAAVAFADAQKTRCELGACSTRSSNLVGVAGVVVSRIVSTISLVTSRTLTKYRERLRARERVFSYSERNYASKILL